MSNLDWMYPYYQIGHLIKDSTEIDQIRLRVNRVEPDPAEYEANSPLARQVYQLKNDALDLLRQVEYRATAMDRQAQRIEELESQRSPEYRKRAQAAEEQNALLRSTNADLRHLAEELAGYLGVKLTLPPEPKPL